MDGERFDSLAKLMAARSRRGLLRLLAGGALAVGAAAPDRRFALG